LKKFLFLVTAAILNGGRCLWNHWTKLNQTWQWWSLGGSLSKLCPTAPPYIQDGCCY
jgi:hypothetical protein